MFSAIVLVVFLISCEAYNVQKYVNPCGAVYSSITLNTHGVKTVFHHMKPYIMELIHSLKPSKHKFMEEYEYKKTWIPEEENIVLTNNVLNSAKQLPEIHRSLLYFSYALDVIKEDTLNAEQTDDCFFVIDSISDVISKHQQLICAVDSGMGQLNIEVPTIKEITLPNDWLNAGENSCVDKFFRFAEVHTKYNKFLHRLFYLTHI